MHPVSLFPTKLAVFYRQPQEQERAWCWRYYEQDQRGQQIAQDFKPDSYSSIHTKQDLWRVPELQSLHLWFKQCVDEYQTALGEQDVLDFQTSWFNVFNQGDVSPVHIHKQCMVSGVYYVDATEQDGAWYALSPLEPYQQYRGTTSDDRTRVSPETGKLILFPSWLRHGVEQQRNTKPRISLAFNMDIQR